MPWGNCDAEAERLRARVRLLETLLRETARGLDAATTQREKADLQRRADEALSAPGVSLPCR